MTRSGRSWWSLPALLARLDRRVVPLLQWLARAVAWLLGWPFRTLTRAELRTRLGRSLHRKGGLLLLASVAVAFLASAVHFQRYPDLREGADATAPLPEDEPAIEPGPAAPTDDVPAAVGPVLGTDVEDHVQRSSASLGGLAEDAPRLAVLSYDDYRTPAAVLGTLPDGVEVLEVQYRLPAEAERPRRLETDREGLVAAVEGAVDAARDEFAAEEHEVQRLLDSDTVEEEDFRADLELRLSELQSIRNLLDTEAPVVFAVVIRAPGGGLRALSGHAGVRLVDVAPTDADAQATVFYGVLPEDRDRATFGRAA